MKAKFLRAFACALVLAAALAVAGPASAGQYTVYSCGGPAGGANNLFRGQADAGTTAYGANCPVNPYAGNDNMGLVARTVKQSGSVGWLQGAYLIMDAPGGAQVGAVHADVNLDRPYSDSPYWSLGVVGFGTDSDRGINTNAGMAWGSGAPASFSQAFYAGHIDVGVNKPSVRFETRCGAPNFGSCAIHAHSIADAYFSVWNISVDVTDGTAPSISNARSGLASGSWQRGNQSIVWDSADNVGIKSASLVVDGGTVQNWNNSCDYTQVKPCGDLPSGSFSYNTDSLSNGSHAVAVYVTDTAGNTSSWSNTIYVDKSAPAAPSVSTSGSWSKTNSFSATVTNANGQNAPVSKIYYQVCDAAGANCGATQQANPSNAGNGGQTTISGITVPGDGDYTVRAYEQDSVGNVDASTLSSAGTAHLKLDRSAPAAPTATAVDGNGDWQSTNSFRLSWTNPGSQLAPISKAYIVVCNASNVCTTSSQSASDINQATNVTVPGVGEYTTTVYLEDTAGNNAMANKSGAVTLRFDNTTPGTTQLGYKNGWLNAVEAKGYTETVNYPNTSLQVPSGIKGYSFSTDGTDPDATLDVPVTGGVQDQWPAKAVLADLPEGSVTVKARAISRSGVAGSTFDAVTLKVDKTAPSASIDGAPDPGQWMTSSVKFIVNGADALSGMAAAPSNQPVTNGGYISYRIDDGQPVSVEGSTAQPVVSSDGVHTVYYRAYDVAGNASPEQSVKVRIDVTAPTGSFEARDANAPTTFIADVSDAASGIADGTIQIQPQGGTWQSVATSYDGAGHLVAKIDDSQLPQGIYAMRALVKDNAGNQGVVDTRGADGGPMQVAFPLRGATVVDASTKIVATTSCKTVKITRLRRGKKIAKRLKVCKPTKLPAKRKGAKRVTVKPSVKKATYMYVHLKDAAGNPIKDAAVMVAEQPKTGGGFAEKAHLATDSNGNLQYAIAKGGPSRTIRAAFPGNDLLQPAASEVQVLTPASTTIKASKKTIKAGRKVVFKGSLAGAYVPSAGKLVNLQVFFRGKWRTFATPRASAKTRAWKYTYKFTAKYRKALTYTFRALVPVEQAYPYEAGQSAVVKVVVRP